MGIKHYSCDVLIIGGGLAGLQAAIAIQEKAPKKKVVIADLGGGASSEIMGFCAPLAPGDSPEIFAADIMRVGGGENDPALVKRLTEGAVETVRQLEALGIEFDRNDNQEYDLLKPLGSSFPRVVHYKTVTGKAVMEKYRKILADNKLVSFHKSRIVKLFKDNGRIAGALAFEGGEPFVYNTGNIILATGGGAGLFAFSSWTKILNGSGYALALDAGAELIEMKRIQFEPCVSVYPEKLYGFPVITTLLYEGVRLIDGNGDPVVDEPLPKRELALRIASVVAAGKDCGHGGVWFDFSGVDEKTFKAKYPEYYSKLRPFADKFADLRIEVKPAPHTTLGGIKINAAAETSIPGLFAAGEVTGGIHGRDRIGGNAGLEVLVFGRAAGESAAAYDVPPIDISVCAESFLAELKTGSGVWKDFLRKLGKLLDEYCDILRSPEKLAKGRNELSRLTNALNDNPPPEIGNYLIYRQALLTANLFTELK